jgi:hypothetical protein
VGVTVAVRVNTVMTVCVGVRSAIVAVIVSVRMAVSCLSVIVIVRVRSAIVAVIMSVRSIVQLGIADLPGSLWVVMRSGCFGERCGRSFIHVLTTSCKSRSRKGEFRFLRQLRPVFLILHYTCRE